MLAKLVRRGVKQKYIVFINFITIFHNILIIQDAFTFISIYTITGVLEIHTLTHTYPKKGIARDLLLVIIRKLHICDVRPHDITRCSTLKNDVSDLSLRKRIHTCADEIL